MFGIEFILPLHILIINWWSTYSKVDIVVYIYLTKRWDVYFCYNTCITEFYSLLCEWFSARSSIYLMCMLSFGLTVFVLQVYVYIRIMCALNMPCWNTKRKRIWERERERERKRKEESTYWYNIHCLTKPRSFKCLKISFYAGQNLPSMYPPKITNTTYYINILDVFQ